jgi:D-inositol-3-phosphate glycosyltransferase
MSPGGFAAPSLTDHAALGTRHGDHDLIHTHYWLSGLVGVQLKARSGIPLVHTMHTMARVKNSTLGEDQLVEPHVREHGESAIVRAADVLTASTTDEAAELQDQYCARAGQIMIVHRRRLRRASSIPATSPSHEPSSVCLRTSG